MSPSLQIQPNSLSFSMCFTCRLFASPTLHIDHTPLNYLHCVLGVDFYTKALKIDGKLVSLQLWDTAGQERFQSVTKAYYRGAQGVILMYDITQEESFIAVKSWINSIQVSELWGARVKVQCTCLL